MACGTGSCAVELSRCGYEMSCSDVSPEMIEQARRKAEAAGCEISFQIADMRSVDIPRQADCVICLYDSINYMTDAASVGGVLSNVHRKLRTDGYFIFDMCTHKNSMDNFKGRYEQDSDVGYTRVSTYMESQRMQVNEIRLRDGGAIYCEIHRQKIYRLREMKAMIRDSGMHLENCYADLTLSPGTEKADRIHFVVRNSA